MNDTLEIPVEDKPVTEQESQEPAIPSTNGNTTASVAQVKRPAPTRILPTDRVQWDSQVELIRAFAAVHSSNGGQPVTSDNAGEVISKKLRGATVGQATSFYCDIKLLERAEKVPGFIPSKELIDYNRVLQWDKGEAKAKLRPVFERTWFYRALVPRLQIAPQPIKLCLAALAGESGATPEHDEKLTNILRFLELAGIITLTSTMVSLAQPQQTQAPVETPSQSAPTAPPAPTDGQERHTLYLDKERTKRVDLTAPLVITRADYKRICAWVEVTLIVEDDTPKT